MQRKNSKQARENTITEPNADQRLFKRQREAVDADGLRPMEIDDVYIELVEQDPLGLLVPANLPLPTIQQKPPFPSYDVKNPEHMAALQLKLQPVELILEDQDKTPDVTIAPVGLLGELGVYAKTDIIVKPGKKRFLGVYKGKRIENFNDQFSESQYIFYLHNGDVIDAAESRNWTAFMNHSYFNNIILDEYYIDENHDKTEMGFVATRTIKAGEPLYLNYGPLYFTNFDPIYLGPKDNVKTLEDIWQENREQYDKETWLINPELRASLGFQSHGPYLIPNLFKAVVENNKNTIRLLLSDQNTQAGLMPLAINPDSSDIYSIDQQEKVTPFMLACYLGDIETIQIFFEHYKALMMGAPVDFSLFNDRCWKSGKTALFYLLEGKASTETKCMVLNEFLKLRRTMIMEKKYDVNCVNCYFTLLDNKNNSLLDYCLREKLHECVAMLLKVTNLKRQFYTLMHKDSFLNLLPTMFAGDAQTLNVILKNANESNLAKIKEFIQNHINLFTKADIDALLPLLGKYLGNLDLKVNTDKQEEVSLSQSHTLLWQPAPSDINKLLHYIVYGNLDEAKAMLDVDPDLIRLTGSVQTPSGLIVENVKPYECAQGCYDKQMTNMIAEYFAKYPKGAADKAQQDAKYRQYAQDLLDPAKNPPYDFTYLIDTLKKASYEDVIAAAKLDMNHASPLRDALIQFRNDFTPGRINGGMHFNHYNLLQLFRIYSREFKNLRIKLNHEDWHRYDKIILFGNQIFGFIQRSLPAIDRMLIVQNRYIRHNHAMFDFPRIFQNPKNLSEFPITANDKSCTGLGYEYHILGERDKGQMMVWGLTRSYIKQHLKNLGIDTSKDYLLKASSNPSNTLRYTAPWHSDE